jgi:hypothetical protein
MQSINPVPLYGVRHKKSGKYWNGCKYAYDERICGLKYGLSFAKKDSQIGKCYDSKKRTITLFKNSLEDHNCNNPKIPYKLEDFELVIYNVTETENIN